MSIGESKPQPTLGFLTVLDNEQQGLVGGYLILNCAGRPLEFHCTAPVKPNRAQQILFGPTLESFLYGEQIGQTLICKSSLEPLVICTDVERVLHVRDYVALPVALVLSSEPDTQTSMAPVPSTAWRVDDPHRAKRPISELAVGRNNLAVSPRYEADRPKIAANLESLAGFDLSEPFERIREAVEEAHKGSRS